VWFVLIIYPNLEIFPLAFYKWNGISKVKKFVGFENSSIIFSQQRFKQQLINTALYVLFLLLVQTVTSVPLVNILKTNTTHNKFFRTFFFLPLVFSSVMVGLTWSYMYDPNCGILNELLTKIGLEGFKGFAWLGTPVRAIFFIVIVHIWANIGYPITILTAGLKNIPDTLYEAADVEGCGKIRAFWSITLPLLMPTIMRLLLLTISTGAMAFDYVFFLMGSSLVPTEFDTLSVSVYRGITSGQNLGLPCALSVMMAIVLLVVFVIQYIVTNKIENAIN